MVNWKSSRMSLRSTRMGQGSSWLIEGLLPPPPWRHSWKGQQLTGCTKPKSLNWEGKRNFGRGWAFLSVGPNWGRGRHSLKPEYKPFLGANWKELLPEPGRKDTSLYEVGWHKEDGVTMEEDQNSTTSLWQVSEACKQRPSWIGNPQDKGDGRPFMGGAPRAEWEPV